MKKTLTLILFALLAFAQTAWAQNIVSVDYVDENGTPQNVNATSLDHIASVNPNGANIGSTGFTNWYVVQGNDVVLNGVQSSPSTMPMAMLSKALTKPRPLPR